MAGQTPPPASHADPERTTRQITLLHEAFLTSGSDHRVEEFTALLDRIRARSPDSEMSLNNLARFAETTVSKASFFNDLLQYPVLEDLFTTLAGSSQYFADILVREPGLFRWLSTSDALLAPVRPEDLRREARRIRETFASPDRRLNALKRLHRRELLRIGSRDLLGLGDVRETTSQLSELADVMVDEVLALSLDQMKERVTTSPAVPFAVIGLGKLGGGELNYSSDIDLMFVYGEGKRPSEQKASMDVQTYFHKLGERLIQNLSQPTAEGYCYRVDMRLRPESGAGPLARSLTWMLLYYESRGELWERQMLIKARPIAGDVAFGGDFIQRLQPFVYPRTSFHHPADYVARIKARIEATVGGAENVKLMPGGIRDIEFIVQTLQLINGGVRTAIRESNTLRAIPLLEREGLLENAEARTLSDAYEFYRNLEHRLQVVMNTQTHTLPADHGVRDSLARRLGLEGRTELDSLLRRHLEDVRRVYGHVLSVPATETNTGILAVIDGGIDEEALHRVLASNGFRDARRALRNLRTLTSGSALTTEKQLDTRTREAFIENAPALFAAIAATPNPDMTLNGITAVLSSSRAPGQYYTSLSSAGFRKLLITICRMSPRFARDLAADPMFLETLVARPEALKERPEFSRQELRDAVRFKRGQELRAGLRHVLGFSDFDGLTNDISRIADALVRKAIADELKVRRISKDALAVFALGKFGTAELLFDADLDLLFLCRDRDLAKRAMQEVGSGILKRLTVVSETGRLYQADSRLRPEGRNAPLVTGAGRYADYLVKRASLWERQALTRLRFVGGSERLGQEIRLIVEGFVYSAPLSRGWAGEIASMRRKMEGRSHFRGETPLDVKVGAGGMVDVEFTAQVVQLKLGGADQSFRGRTTTSIIERVPTDLLPADDASVLVESYRLYREVEKILRITLEEGGAMLPVGERRETVARIMDYPDGKALTQRLESAMRETRMIFTTFIERCGA